ncbi:uncharacterized protein [Henckelia pumila]|uniref:uncharacterized protein n=1 Tax=Henckelia pumila TaxID=405737 RepID=UPI003C6EA1C5
MDKSWIRSDRRSKQYEEGITKWPGFKQLTGNLKQNGSVECGYYVMRYMKEKVECEDLHVERMFAGCIKNQCYSQEQFEEVRSEWSEFVYSHWGQDVQCFKRYS